MTGMSGTGKSTLLAELARRGYRTVDTDDPGWCVPAADGSELIWDERRMSALLAIRDQVPLVVQGTVSNQGLFSDRFAATVLLSAPAEVILARVAARADNPYGSTAEQRAEILVNLEAVEPLLRASCDVEFDATRSTAELADEVEALLR